MKKIYYRRKREFSYYVLLKPGALTLLFLLFSCTKAVEVPKQDPPKPVVEINTEIATPAQTLLPSAPEAMTATPTPTASVEEAGQVNLQTGVGTPESSLRVFDQFVQDLKNGNHDQVVGLWVENIMALRVIYQPSNKPGFVSTEDETATYFLYPWEKAGNYGFLAHNYLAGRYFFNIKIGDVITVVFGDGDYEDFEVTEVKEFQALQPDSPYSDYIDLQSGEQLTVNNVFVEVYMGDFHTTLQTCIANGTETEWGRQFTIAPPSD